MLKVLSAIITAFCMLFSAPPVELPSPPVELPSDMGKWFSDTEQSGVEFVFTEDGFIEIKHTDQDYLIIDIPFEIDDFDYNAEWIHSQVKDYPNFNNDLLDAVYLTSSIIHTIEFYSDIGYNIASYGWFKTYEDYYGFDMTVTKDQGRIRFDFSEQVYVEMRFKDEILVSLDLCIPGLINPDGSTVEILIPILQKK